MIKLRFIDDGAGLAEISTKAIQAAQYGFWPCHVDAVMPDGSFLGARLVGGVAIRPATYVVPKQQATMLITGTNDEQVERFYDFLKAQVGKPYDWRAIAAFATGEDVTTRGAWFCSELQTAALLACSYFQKLVVPANKITPRDLMLILSSHADTRELPA